MLTLLSFIAQLSIEPGPQSGSSSCYIWESCKPAQVSIVNDVVSFHGIIDSISVTEAERLLHREGELDIWSVGGNRRAAMEFGRFIFRNNIRVLVRSQCLSSCALYVFSPARRKSVDEFAVVLFHEPAFVWAEAARANPGIFSDAERDEIMSSSREEAELFEEAGINEGMLACMAELQHFDYTKYLRDESINPPERDSSGVRLLGARYAWVAFSLTALKSYGVGGIDHYSYRFDVHSRQALGRRFGPIAWVDEVANRRCPS
jgi:hypothetical protein